MDGYVTCYTRRVRRRRTGLVTTIGCIYRTKNLTGMHALIRSKYADAVTIKDPKRVITDLIPGMNLLCFPLVTGGIFIAGANFPYPWQSSVVLAERQPPKRRY